MKKIKILLIILFLAFFRIINVSSINIEYVGEADENALRSDKCGGNYCATDLQGSGIRISLLNSDAKTIIAQVDFWPEKMYNYIKNGDKANIKEYSGICKNFKKKVAENSSQKTIKTFDETYDNSSGVNIGLPSDINDKNASSKYKTFVEQITANSNEKLAKILNELGTNLENAIDNNQILRIEPIYIIREFLTPDYCNDYSGTSYDIINNFGKKYCLNCTETGLGKSYLTGGGKKDGNKVWDVVYNNRSEGGLIHGNWNVIRNYVVSMYVSDNIENIQKWDNTINSLSGYTAEDNNLWKWTTENQNKLSQWTQDNKDTFLWMYYNNYKNGRPNIGVGYIKISDFKKPQHTLTVNKYKYKNGQRTKDYVSGASMWVYNSSCGLVENFTANGTSKVNIPLSFQLNGNTTYCVVELIEPSGYTVPESESSYKTCTMSGKKYYCKEVYLDDNKTLNFYNEKNCVSEFNSLKNKNSMESRIKLYDKYIAEGFNYNQLLNLNITDASSACTYKKPEYNGKISCFDFSYPYVNFDDNFNERNVSNFNEIYIDNENSQIDFCLTNISIKSDTVLNNKVVNAGQRIFDGKINSNMIKKCYSYKYNSENIQGKSQAYTLPTVLIYEDEYNYIVKPNTSPVFTSEDSSGIKCSGVPCGYQYESKYTYQYIPFNLSFGIGKGFDTFDTSTSKYIKTMNGVTRYYYRNIGNTSGIFSKFMDSGEKSLVFNVNLDLNGNGYTFTSNDESCKYRVKQGLVSETLNLQFEQVNLNNPFIEKNSATTRRVGSNWHSKLITNESIDLNGDGVVNEIDEAIKKYVNDFIKNPEASENGDNYLVKYVMNGRPNSYSKDKPKYVITLTPSDIKTIRNYNDSNDYQDYEKVYCTDSNNVLCSTDFIDNLKTTDPKVCVGDTCEKLSSGINFKREQTSTTVEKKKVNVTFQMRRFFGDIEGGTCEGNTCSLTVALNEGESIEFPKLNLNYKGEFQNWQNKFTGDIVLDSNIIVSNDSVYEANILQYEKYNVMTSIDGKKEKLCMVFGTKNIMEQCQKSLPTPTKDGYKFIGWSNPYISNSDLKITYVARFEILSQFKDFEVILNQNSFALNSKINIKDYITVNKIMQKGTNETRSRYINYSVVGFDTSNLEDNKKMTIYVSYNNMTYTYERSYNVVMLATDYLDFKDEAFKDKNAGRLKIHNSKGKIDSICVISNYKESKKQEVCAIKKKGDFILDLRDLVPYTTMGSGTYSDFKLKIKATDGTELKCINPNKPEFVIKFDKLIFSSRHVCMCGTIGDAC